MCHGEIPFLFLYNAMVFGRKSLLFFLHSRNIFSILLLAQMNIGDKRVAWFMLALMRQTWYTFGTMISIEKWAVGTSNDNIDTFLRRSAFPQEAEDAAAALLADIRKRGNAAVIDAVAKFEGAHLEPATLRVTDEELGIILHQNIFTFKSIS